MRKKGQDIVIGNANQMFDDLYKRIKSMAKDLKTHDSAIAHLDCRVTQLSKAVHKIDNKGNVE